MRIIESKFNCHARQSSPSFKANIYLVAKSAFKDTLEKLPDAFEVGRTNNSDWLISEAAVNKVSAFTQDVYNCVFGSIFNPETRRVNLFHLSPYEKTMSDIQKVMAQVIEQAKELKGSSKCRLEGLLMGGNPPKKDGVIASIMHEVRQKAGTSVYDKSDRQTYWDVELLKSMKKAFSEISEKLGMDYSVIADRKFPCCASVISDASKNTHYVYIGNAYPPVRVVSDLKDLYKTRIISPKDTISMM